MTASPSPGDHRATRSSGPRSTRPEIAAPWGLAPESVAASLGTDTQSGLSDEEASDRLVRFGPNQIRTAPPRGALAILLAQFRDWMIGLLLAAAIVSSLIGEWKDSLLIMAIIAANAVIGFVQERRAEDAVAALKRLARPIARVLRAGQWRDGPAGELVPGDIIELGPGSIVPADARVVETAELQTDEAPLTGESLSVTKATEAVPSDAAVADRTSMVFAGTAAVAGRGLAIVTSTGMDTELGKIAALLETAEAAPTPLQVRLVELSRRLAIIVVGICLVVFLAGVLRPEPLPINVMFMTAVSLAVAAVPEGLPAVITVALALGSLRMARRRAIIRQLAAVETLGSVNVICTDKTGTLTQNKMRVVDILPAAVADAEATVGLLRAAALCNNAHTGPDGEVMGTATEAALLTAARDHGIDLAQLAGAKRREGEIPFSSARKRMSTIHRDGDDRWVVYVKGAAETILERTTTIVEDGVAISIDDDRHQELAAQFDLLAGRGHRMLGLARRVFTDEPTAADAETVERDLELLGFVGIVDPLREEAIDAVTQCRAAGIRAVMITGDHVGTARSIADELGLVGPDDEVLVGRDIEAMDDEQLRQRAPRVAVYARVSPEHKLRIVRAHQAHGAVVAMTGDGVNDAPALKQADIGVAMGITGTDVSKEASNMILADDNFATIVSAVEEGRVVYDNIRKFVRYLLTANCGEVLLLFLAILTLPRLPLPLLPVHLLWINLVTDGLPALALGFEPAELGVMSRPPRRRDESVFADRMVSDIVGLGLFMAICCLVLYWFYAPSPERLAAGADASIDYARTAVFFTLAMFQLFYVMAVRSSTESLFAQGLLSNYRLSGAVALGFVAQLLVIYTPPLASIFHTAPLGLWDLIICLAVASSAFVMVELQKALRRRSLQHV